MKLQLRDKDNKLITEWLVDAEGVDEWIGDAVVEAIDAAKDDRPPH